MLTDVFYPDTIGGAGRMAYQNSLELSKKGHEVHVITRNINGKLSPYEKLTTNLNIHRFLVPSENSISLFIFEIINSHRVFKKIYNVTFDLICMHQSLPAISPILSGAMENVPTIYYYYSPWSEEFLIKNQNKIYFTNNCIASVMKWVEWKALQNANKIIVMSDYMSNELLKLHKKISTNKIIKIPGAVDLAYFNLDKESQIKRALNIPFNKTIFLTVRNLVKRMGLESLIKAFHHSDLLKEKSILLIGGKGPLENYLKSLVSKYKLEDTIRFAGHIPEADLPKYYQAADYFILPTEKLEGFGLVILESMACGTPVIGTPVGAIPELIGTFDKRLLTNGTGSYDIKEKLEEIVNNPDEYLFESQTCRKFVEDNYSWEKVADEFEKAALDLVLQKGQSSQ
ncbi:glycosyltransferase family 4 protein [Thermodesulfobacteriota bacterium]